VIDLQRERFSQFTQQPYRKLPQCDKPKQAKREYYPGFMPPHEPPFKPALRLFNSISHHLPDVPYNGVPAFALNPYRVTRQAHDAHGSAAIADGHGVPLPQGLPA
jgi:hypothetical protein